MTIAALEPVHAALRARAVAAAEQTRAAAQAEAQRVLAAARQQADAILTKARSDGEADAADLLAADRVGARHAARAVVLAAQHEVYEQLQEQARNATGHRLTDTSFRQRLTETVRARLGNGACIHDEPGGGLTGVAPDGRTVDASVAALVDQAIARLDLDQLWTP